MNPDEIVAYAGTIAVGAAFVMAGVGAGLGFAVAFGFRVFDYIMRSR